MIEDRTRARYRDLRVFAAGAGCGFLGGALAVFVVVWQLGLTGPRSTSPGSNPGATSVGRAPANPPAAAPTALPPAPPMELDPPDLPSSNTPPPSVPEPGGSSESVVELAGRDLEIPVEGVTADMLTRQFTDNRGEFRIHEALDILAPRNTPVRAVEDGRIVRLFLSKAGGITVYQFDPSERYCYYYAHLERYADGLKEGDVVRKGQLLGYVGTSGNAPGDTPHLHFAVFRLTPEKRWWEGTPLDPYDILR